MERLAELISKLKEQFEQNADSRQLLVITKMIEQELLSEQPKATVAAKPSKIAVMMPASRATGGSQPAYRQADPVNVPAGEDQVKKTEPQPKEELFQKFRENAQPKETPAPSRSQPQRTEKVLPEEHAPYNGDQGNRESIPVNKKPVESTSSENRGWNFDPLNDIPTLAQQDIPKELNDIIASSKTSRNDQLKAEVLEVGHRLTDSPIRDLKKGIGVNDRYVFINELFRGDEVMYERSIKTINNFRIYAEAQYWIERELKVKLGWDDNKSSVKHFYQLVKRRFL